MDLQSPNVKYEPGAYQPVDPYTAPQPVTGTAPIMVHGLPVTVPAGVSQVGPGLFVTASSEHDVTALLSSVGLIVGFVMIVWSLASQGWGILILGIIILALSIFFAVVTKTFKAQFNDNTQTVIVEWNLSVLKLIQPLRLETVAYSDISEICLYHSPGLNSSYYTGMLTMRSTGKKMPMTAFDGAYAGSSMFGSEANLLHQVPLREWGAWMSQRCPSCQVRLAAGC